MIKRILCEKKKNKYSFFSISFLNKNNQSFLGKVCYPENKEKSSCDFSVVTLATTEAAVPGEVYYKV